MGFILFDDKCRDDLLPLTFTRPVAELRVGILRIREKWEKRLKMRASFLTQDYLQEKYAVRIAATNLLINGSVLPDETLIEEMQGLTPGKALRKGDVLLAVSTNRGSFDINDSSLLESASEYEGSVARIDRPWKIFSLNGQEIASDFELLTRGRKSASLSKTVNVVQGERVFIEEGFRGEHFTINASSGPIYLGKDSEIMEGSVIRGPFALCEHATVKMGSKIYGPTTIGPHSKAGGEINNSVLTGFSNKGHDGFLGNAVIGEWCNLGADTNNSNLKNNYTEVKIWNYPAGRFMNTGLQFCGLIMGDHSKCGISTMFNTGTVVGVSANIFGAGFPRNFVPSFTWGGAAGLTVYQPDKAIETMERVMKRRGIQLSSSDRDIFSHLFRETEKYRERLEK